MTGRFRIAFPQSVIALLIIAGAGYFAGTRGALSVVFGGFACFVPSLLFTLYLKHVSHCAESWVLVRLFVGELTKIALSIGLLVLVMKFYEPHWISLFIGMVVGVGLALQASFWAIRKNS